MLVVLKVQVHKGLLKFCACFLLWSNMDRPFYPIQMSPVHRTGVLLVILNIRTNIFNNTISTTTIYSGWKIGQRHIHVSIYI